jgi:hypothetical protein
MLYVDIPTEGDLAALAAHREDGCVSIYLPTTPVTPDTAADRIELGNLAKEATRQLEDARVDKRRIAALKEQLDDLIDDHEFWRFQARSLAVLATGDHVQTFRVANVLEPLVAVADRFHLKPLLRATSVPQAAYVLALAENSVRLVEVSADLPAIAVRVDGMPKDAASAAGKASLGDRSPSGRIQGSEGKKVRLRQYARKVDQVLRGLLSGSGVPLVLVAAEPLASIYSSVNSYADLTRETLDGNPETQSDAELGQRARAVLDGLHRERIKAWAERFAAREQQGRATTDLAHAARAATFGAVDSLLVDIDEVIPGTVDETSGAVAFADTASAASYGVADEIARRVILARGQVLAVRREDIPERKPLAAILRHAI